MKACLIIVIIIISLLNSGCHHCSISHIGPTYVADLPVMLGNVRKIGGTPMKLGKKKNDFVIGNDSGSQGISILTWKQMNLVDRVDEYDELKNKVNSRDNLIKVDRVYFGSASQMFTTFVVNTFSYQSTTGIQGGIYEALGAEQIKNSVENMRASAEKP